MKRRMNRLLVVSGVLALVGGVFGCGDDDGDSGALPLHEVQASYMHSYCQVAMDCNFDPVVTLFNGDVDTCVEFLELSGDMDTALGFVIDSVNAGNTAYDGELARQCLDAMDSMTCAEAYSDGQPDPSCEQTFTGLLDNGTACSLDAECLGGWCDITAACPGVCADTVLVGGDCSMGETCESGALCEGGLCILDPGPLQLGDDCVESYRDCAYGLWCDWGGNGVCENRVAVGQGCEDSDQCEHGLFCDAEGSCAVAQVATQVGDACGGYEYGPFCDMAGGLGCEAEYLETVNHTVCVEVLPAGSACMVMDSMTEIVTISPCDAFAGLYCDMDLQNYTGVCMAKKSGGQECDEDQECESADCQEIGTCAPVSTDPCD